jgi:nitrogenase molybdenum-iron protein beta chain
MSRILDQQRYSCALGGLKTVQAIEGAIPVLHSGPGCAIRLGYGVGSSGKFSPNIFPCTSISEKEVVFGGTEKLRSTIENALKIIDAELFVVLTGCTAEIIGDDVGEVVSEFADAEKPVVYANTPGFSGNNYEGHGIVLKALFDRYLPKRIIGGKEKGLVNIWSSPPYTDPYWYSSYRELETLVASIGLTPNTIFGYDRGKTNLDRVPNAEFNILVAPWTGYEAVKFLSEKYNTPFLHYPVLPIGAFESTKFLKRVGEFADLDPQKVESVVDKFEKEYYHMIERYADIFLEMRIISKRFSIIGDAHYALALTKFLTNDLGMFPNTSYITDKTPEQFNQLVIDEFADLNYGIVGEVRFETDGFEIQKHLKTQDFAGFPLIIGSQWDQKVADELSANFVNLTSPIVSNIIINSHLTGYAGGLKVLEDIFSAGMKRLVL